jgi:hypothetical protein
MEPRLSPPSNGLADGLAAAPHHRRLGLRHEQWLQACARPVVRLDGMLPTATLAQQVLDALDHPAP